MGISKATARMLREGKRLKIKNENNKKKRVVERR